ncbi:type II toxin-antitoxin system HicA family toxin, partial [Levilactobacillus zymae]|uniref:type II toxin-antitoxin system HicA family toxin n=1 Tax=Levilactobacillus zymae TaxID=267363 RepID=UPI003FCD2204
MPMKPRQMIKLLKENGFIEKSQNGSSHLKLYNPANYKFNPNKPGIFQWQSVDDVFLMV